MSIEAYYGGGSRQLWAVEGITNFFLSNSGAQFIGQPNYLSESKLEISTEEQKKIELSLNKIFRLDY